MSILAHENVASPAAKMPPQIMRTCRGPFTCPTTRGGGLLLGAMLVCDRRVDCGNLTLCVQGNRENEAAWRVAIFKSLPTLPRGCQLSRPGPGVSVGRQSLLGAEVLCGAHGSCNAIARIVDPNHRPWNPCQLPRYTRTDELTMQDSKHTQNKKRCVNVMIKGARRGAHRPCPCCELSSDNGEAGGQERLGVVAALPQRHGFLPANAMSVGSCAMAVLGVNNAARIVSISPTRGHTLLGGRDSGLTFP